MQDISCRVLLHVLDIQPASNTYTVVLISAANIDRFSHNLMTKFHLVLITIIVVIFIDIHFQPSTCIHFRVEFGKTF